MCILVTHTGESYVKSTRFAKTVFLSGYPKWINFFLALICKFKLTTLFLFLIISGLFSVYLIGQKYPKINRIGQAKIQFV